MLQLADPPAQLVVPACYVRLGVELGNDVDFLSVAVLAFAVV